MKNRKTTLFPLALLISACAADELSLDEDEIARDSPAELATEKSLDSTLFADENEDIEIVYHEATASMEVLVNVEKLKRTARGSTVEMQIDVTTPNGATTRHDVDWTNGEKQDVPRIAAPVVHDGLYEVVVTDLAVDGRTLEGPFTRLRMEVQGGDDPQEAPGGGGGHHDDDDGDGGDWHDDDDDDGGDWHDDDDDDGGDWHDDDDDDGGWDGGGGGHGGGHKCKQGKKKHGSDYGDKIHGTDRNDKIYGYDGKDKLFGYDCHDELYGGNGRDTLKGGEGKDFLHGGKGEDSCDGGPGKDEFRSCEYVKY